jgi:cellulose synthase/poly-beta-1,6-N-acetylglucosamine synthase-like glycosyltransferase
MEVAVNYLAVLVAAVVSMALGFAWYSPAVLGKQWMKEKGYTPEGLKKEQSQMGKWYGVSFVLSLLTAYLMWHVMVMSNAFFGNPMMQTGFTTAIFMWLGFVMPTQATATIFGNKNWKLFGIDTGYQLVSLILMAVVLAWMA